MQQQEFCQNFKRLVEEQIKKKKAKLEELRDELDIYGRKYNELDVNYDLKERSKTVLNEVLKCIRD